MRELQFMSISFLEVTRDHRPRSLVTRSSALPRAALILLKAPAVFLGDLTPPSFDYSPPPRTPPRMTFTSCPYLDRLPSDTSPVTRVPSPMREVHFVVYETTCSMPVVN